MAHVLVFEEQIEIPMELRDLADFRAWATSDAFPQRGRIDYIQGRIEVDLAPEDLHTHGKLKVEIVGVLWTHVKQGRLGELYSDRTRVSCPVGDVSAEPDLVFVSEEALNSGRVRPVPKAGGGEDRYIEFEGPPQLIVEIVSDSSVRKDTRRLPAAYFQAGVDEFWLVDARTAPLRFEIHRRGPEAYEPAESDAEGYQRSAVMDRWYKLERRRNAHGRLEFDLLAK